MKRCIIFCAAEFDAPVAPLMPEDTVIAADGGLRHCRRLGIRPDVILGDFDSLGYVPEGAEVFPVEKDDTDAMLAVRQGLRLGCREFLLYGSLDGPRLDHTVANFQTLRYLCDHGAWGYLVGREQLVTAVKNGSVSFPEEAAGDLSVFCLGPDAEGVSETGTEYTLDDVTLTGSFPLGVSNHFVGEKAVISVKKGTLLLIWSRKAGLPAGREHDADL